MDSRRDTPTRWTRRAALLTIAGSVAYAVGKANAAKAQIAAADPMAPIAIPSPFPGATEYALEIPGARLWVRDTGGSGPTVILLHAYSGSYESWPYQENLFAAGGFRVISYSRRGHRNSSPRAPDVSDSTDLAALTQKLGIGKFHAVGTAAGGGVAANFAIHQPGSLLTLTIVGSILSIRDPAYAKLGETLRPPPFQALPAHIQELGPSYRAINPEGVRAWNEQHDRAWIDHKAPGFDPGNVTWEGLSSLRMPVLLITGEADLYTPPVVMRMFAARIPNSELVVLGEAGHAPAWERPDVFNKTVLSFLRKYS